MSPLLKENMRWS